MAEQAEADHTNALYDRDLFAWTQEQGRLLRERRFSDLDLDNLIDEVESVGSSEKREIRSRLKGLLAHLLKWKVQPGRRGESWRRSIAEQRDQLRAIVEASPSLRSYLVGSVERAYLGATVDASEETGLSIGIMPRECPFTVDQVFDPAFYPEDASSE